MATTQSKTPETHHFNGGWAFFSSIGPSRANRGGSTGYYGAFFTLDVPSDVNIYHNERDDSDLPLSAILIPY